MLTASVSPLLTLFVPYVPMCSDPVDGGMIATSEVLVVSLAAMLVAIPAPTKSGPYL